VFTASLRSSCVRARSGEEERSSWWWPSTWGSPGDGFTTRSYSGRSSTRVVWCDRAVTGRARGRDADATPAVVGVASWPRRQVTSRRGVALMPWPWRPVGLALGAAAAGRQTDRAIFFLLPRSIGDPACTNTMWTVVDWLVPVPADRRIQGPDDRVARQPELPPLDE
jgi:hypothetical protein